MVFWWLRARGSLLCRLVGIWGGVVRTNVSALPKRRVCLDGSTPSSCKHDRQTSQCAVPLVGFMFISLAHTKGNDVSLRETQRKCVHGGVPPCRSPQVCALFVRGGLKFIVRWLRCYSLWLREILRLSLRESSRVAGERAIHAVFKYEHTPASFSVSLAK